MFTLGSNALVSSMPESVKEIFIRVFARIPQRVFWKWETGTSDSTEISTNVKMVDWLPQQDLLGKRLKKKKEIEKSNISSWWRSNRAQKRTAFHFARRTVGNSRNNLPRCTDSRPTTRKRSTKVEIIYHRI